MPAAKRPTIRVPSAVFVGLCEAARASGISIRKLRRMTTARLEFELASAILHDDISVWSVAAEAIITQADKVIEELRNRQPGLVKE
jgi:hypothetical protein